METTRIRPPLLVRFASLVDSCPPRTDLVLSLAVGALWASADGNKLYQWGGQFQDTPTVPPPEARTFVYDIPSNEWSVVQTNGDQVGNAAEGQPAIVPGLGANGDNLAFCAFASECPNPRFD